MEATLYYFTGTGNSLAAARRLASALGSPAPSPVAPLLGGGEAAPDADAVGLVYPVHHWGPADIVLRFARRLRSRDEAYVFAVATYGNHSGRAFQGLDEALRERGHGLDAGFHLRMVQNYAPVFYMATPDEARRTLERAGARVDEIAEAVRARGRGEREHWRYRPFVRMTYLSSKRGLHRKDVHFSVGDTCDGCGVCARVCPVGNIEMAGGRPVWQHRCEQCLACLHWCPRAAIEWGGSTRGMGRYHHPDVTVEDMEGQAVSE